MNKQARLEQMQKICELNFGKVIKGSEMLPKIRIKTGNKSLDEALGGGVPQGSIIEIHGTENSGKTALALHIVKAFQKKNKLIVIKDSDNGMCYPYMKRHGIKAKNIYMLNTVTLEDTFTCITDLIPCTDLIVVDSLHAIPSQMECEPGGILLENRTAKVMSNRWAILKALCVKHNCTLVIINQMREIVGVLFGSKLNATGGRALKSYATISLYTHYMGVVKKSYDVVGQDCRIDIMKNQLSKPYTEANVTFMYNVGMI